MKSKKATVLMPFFLLACGIASYAQVPIDYENFVEYEKIYTVNSQSVIPANQSTKDYYIGTYFTDGRIDDWITVCGDDEDMPEVSAGKGVVEDVSIAGSDVLRVHFGQVRGRGKLIVALKVPPYDHQSDSLRIVVINYDKNGTAVPRPDDPRYKLGMRHFSIHTYADSLAQDTLTSKSYVDGFGRIVQTSGVGASPEGGDIIDIAEYDIMGRESKKYLPFVADTSGALVYNPAVQEKFYADKYKDSLNAAYAYSKTDYDGSPLGVVASTSPAGEGINSDSPDGGSPTVYGYRQNMVQDSIWHFELDSLNPCVVHKTGFYPKEVLCLKSSCLKVDNDTFDPVAEYYDCEGRKVMVQSSDASQRVYYVYDAFGRLCFTIPQVSAARMNEQRAYDMTDSILSEYCYLKVYDKYGNVVKEYTPGASPSIYIYDMRNRLVLAQDPSQRQKNLWAFSKYDIFDRPVMVGVIVGGTEEEYREAVSRDTVAGESRLYATTSVYPYTDECFPVLSQTEHEVYGINYYDNYDWTDIEWRGDADSVNYAVSGLLTRTASKVLGEDKWMNKVVYYDSRYRKIRQYSDLYPDGVETVRMSYDFQNRLTGEYVRQRTSAGTEGYDRTYSYDIEGRLLQIRQRVAGDTRTEEVELATYTYDDLGERLTRRFGNGTRTTYKRNLTGTNIIENGPVKLQRKYGNEVSYFGKRQPYTRLAEFTWSNQRGKNGYAYDYDASGRLLEGAYLQVQGTSESQEDYDILVRNSVHLDYDTSTDNIACITRSGTPMPMNYSGYRMTNVQIPGDTMSGTFLYDAAGNLLYDAVSRQKYEYNPVGRLQTLWNVPENPTDTVSVYTDVWLTYDKVSNPAVWRQMHMLYPDYFDINGDIHSAYRAEQWNGEYYDFYYIPKKYPLLAGDSYSESGVGHTFEYLGGTPEKTAFVYYQGPEQINTSCWLYKWGTPSNGEALHEAYPDYFMSDGDISYSYLISGTTNCFMIPEHYLELADMGYVNTLTSGAYEVRYYSMEPPVPGYVPEPEIMIDNFIDIPVRRNKFVKCSISGYSSDFVDYAHQYYPKYFEWMSASIHHSYHIRDDYYYLPTEYSGLLNDPFSQFDFVDWEIIDYYPGLGTPPTIIEVPATDNKHMEVVYNGQGEKLAVKFYDGITGSVSSQIFYNGSLTYIKEGTAAMSLRDMQTPEGVVVKTATGYAYRYFMRDYLNSVRHVSGIEQLTDYDPLGAVISSVNLDKNSYLYESKERYADFSDAYDDVYDFGARFYNPLYGRWFAPDPAKQGINPYIYCGNNPVMFVDPDGNIWRRALIRDALISLINNKITELETENIRLQEKIFERESEGKKTTRLTNKKTDNEKRISELEGSLETIDLMDKDSRVYDLRTISPQSQGKVTLETDVIYIEGASIALQLHEIAHVGSAIKTGVFNFKNNMLTYNESVMYDEEIKAYKKQYSFDPLSMPVTIYTGIDEIDKDWIKQIKYTDENGGTRPLYWRQN